MRHNARRQRSGKQNNNQGQGNKKPSRMRVYDSNGPDVRIRGTAWQVTEKYQTLAKDAEASGNWVLAESYWQHAEHYQRIINSFAEETPLSADTRQQDVSPAGYDDLQDTTTNTAQQNTAQEQEYAVA